RFFPFLNEETDEIRMNLKALNAISVLACLLAAALTSGAQSPQQPSASQEAGAQSAEAKTAPLFVYTTPPKISVARLKLNGEEDREIRGNVTFTIAAANYDDTVVGTLVFTIPEEARKKIAEASGKPLTSIPAWVTQKDVVAGFRKGT